MPHLPIPVPTIQIGVCVTVAPFQVEGGAAGHLMTRIPDARRTGDHVTIQRIRSHEHGV